MDSSSSSDLEKIPSKRTPQEATDVVEAIGKSVMHILRSAMRAKADGQGPPALLLIRRDDVVAAFLADVAENQPELLADWTPAEEKKLLRWKIDPIVMTLSQFALMSEFRATHSCLAWHFHGWSGRDGIRSWLSLSPA